MQGSDFDSSFRRRDSFDKLTRDNFKLPQLGYQAQEEVESISIGTSKRSGQRASSMMKDNSRIENRERSSASPKDFETVPQWRKLVNIELQESDSFILKQARGLKLPNSQSKNLNKKPSALSQEEIIHSPVQVPKHRGRNMSSTPARGYGRREDELDFGEDSQFDKKFSPPVEMDSSMITKKNNSFRIRDVQEIPYMIQKNGKLNVRRHQSSEPKRNPNNNGSVSPGRKEKQVAKAYDSKNLMMRKGRIQSSNAKGIEHLILLKGAADHRQKMQEYLRRRGLDEETKIFCFNSKDTHIKRALENLGWVENPNISSSLYHLKWTYRDSEAEYRILNEGQFYNHFCNHQELTMKSGLMRNLMDNGEYGSNALRYFPRCYELGQENQTAEFREDFERTALANLVKNLWKYIKSKISVSYLRAIKERFWTKEKLKEEKTKLKEKKNAYQEYKKLGKHKKCEKYIRRDLNLSQVLYQKKRRISFDADSLEGDEEGTKAIDHFNRWWELSSWLEEERREDFVVELNLTFKALRCLRTIVRQQRRKNLEEEDCYHFSDLSAKAKQSLFAYSKWTASYGAFIDDRAKTFDSSPINWRTPNQDLIYRIYKYHTLLQIFFPQYNVEGSKNIWIIKPMSTSKGSGIFLVDGLEEALESGAKNQSRIIQKYIEKPLILRNSPMSNLNGKKFDIRQWVLVTSMNPLTVYMFSDCYLRVCSSDFNLEDIKNNYRHLTNFSINKEKYGKNVQNSVCELEPLKEYLRETRNLDWDTHIKPRIVNIILKTLFSVCEEIEQKSNCFELFGFDILLDERCKPWLLEVNLSPACTERTPWLMNMLDHMSMEMLKLVLPQHYLQNPMQRNKRATGESFYQSSERTDYSWDLIYKEVGARENKEILGGANTGLEVVGAKLNWKKDQELDKKFNWVR